MTPTVDQIKALPLDVAVTALRVEAAFANPRNHPTKQGHGSALATLSKGEWRAILALLLAPPRRPAEVKP